MTNQVKQEKLLKFLKEGKEMGGTGRVIFDASEMRITLAVPYSDESVKATSEPMEIKVRTGVKPELNLEQFEEKDFNLNDYPTFDSIYVPLTLAQRNKILGSGSAPEPPEKFENHKPSFYGNSESFLLNPQNIIRLVMAYGSKRLEEVGHFSAKILTDLFYETWIEVYENYPKQKLRMQKTNPRKTSISALLRVTPKFMIKAFKSSSKELNSSLFSNANFFPLLGVTVSKKAGQNRFKVFPGNVVSGREIFKYIQTLEIADELS